MMTGAPRRVFARGSRLWCRVKSDTGEWVNKPTPYLVGREDEARRYADALHRGYATLRGGIFRKEHLDTELYMPEMPESVVYMVLLSPQHAPGLIKLGYSTDVHLRMSAYRVTNPLAVLYAYWAGDIEHETWALETLPGRIRTSEVFEVNDLDAVVAKLSRVMKAPLGGLYVKLRS